MLLAVFSDSHGDRRRMEAVIRREHPDAVIFLGDGLRDLEAVRSRFPALPFTAVRGNCDRESFGYEDSAFFEPDGFRIFCAHGHNHGVKYGLDKFGTSVLCSGSALGLFGHTHRAFYREVGGVILMNPGSIGDGLHPTYGLITVENGSAVCRIPEYREDEA